MTRIARPKGERQLAHHYYLIDRARQLEWDLHSPITRSRAIPPAWREIAKATKRSEKVRVTMWVEADVVRFFKSLGAGYQPKMNEVLATFMHAKLAGMLADEETIAEYFERSAEEPRPEVGEVEDGMRRWLRE